eukprot:TRINITY_DN42180_c0_g1_i1.p1 TRINITY_DN42180_c0_g1~~TRINITY_DN42180_c0_g1_i1.p1  ORF type:complete len:357 (-),score=62.38 TRINITY_DN42180_c0_g1_i1:42-1055(-)
MRSTSVRVLFNFHSHDDNADATHHHHHCTAPATISLATVQQHTNPPHLNHSPTSAFQQFHHHPSQSTTGDPEDAELNEEDSHFLAPPARQQQHRRRTRVRVGRYKRSQLFHLLLEKDKYQVLDHCPDLTGRNGFWPEMNTVYVCLDWTCIDSQDMHAIRKVISFSQGSYTQTRVKWADSNWEIRQSRCNGVRTCLECKKVFPRSSRRQYCGRLRVLADDQGNSGPSACTGKIGLVQCHVTVYYMFPSSGEEDSTCGSLVKSGKDLVEAAASAVSAPSSSNDVKTSSASDAMMTDCTDSVSEKLMCSIFNLTVNSRILVCIPDEGHLGHSHGKVTVEE